MYIYVYISKLENMDFPYALCLHQDSLIGLVTTNLFPQRWCPF